MNKNTAITRLKDKLRGVGLKLTKQREAICLVFFSQLGHRKAEEILYETRTVDPKISLATIYRTLKLLQEYGFAHSHKFKDDQALFEPCFDDDAHHDHLICTQCGYIAEFINDDIEKLQMRVASANGFTITNHKMELYGICSICRQTSSNFVKTRATKDL